MQEDPQRILTIRIRDLRRSHELTQEELAGALGISRQSINAMEAGRCLPSLPVAMQLASYFAVPLQELFELEEQVNRVVAVVQQAQQQVQRQQTQHMEAMFQQLLGAPLAENPPVNMYQQADALIVELPLPGYTIQQLHLEVGDDFLTISGAAPAQQGVQYLQQEFAPGPFRRTIALPTPVDRSQTEARFTNGILCVQLRLARQGAAQTAVISIIGD